MPIPLASKDEVARRIVELLAHRLRRQKPAP
jgi:hypothetical protein